MENNRYIWFDFENAPHVWILKPLIESLAQQKYQFLFTARDFSFTKRLLELNQINAWVTPHFNSKNKIYKLVQIFKRSVYLYRFIREKKIALAISHGSRAQVLAAFWRKIPSVSLDDYEESNQFFVRFTTRTYVPSVISREKWRKNQSKIFHYPGLKENVYLNGFNGNAKKLSELNMDPEKINIIFRPGSSKSHYQTVTTFQIEDEILKYLAQYKNVHLYFYPRDPAQEIALGALFEKLKISFSTPTDLENGHIRLWHADLMIGGGGTMMREAAVMGVPAYSYFSGKWGAVDKFLCTENRLNRIQQLSDIPKIRIVKHIEKVSLQNQSREFLLKAVQQMIEENEHAN